HRDKPIGARLNLFGPCGFQRGLSREYVEDTPHSASISILRDVSRLLRAVQKIATGSNTLCRRGKSVVTAPDLQIDLLLKLPRVLARDVHASLSRADIVLRPKACEDRKAHGDTER